MQINKEEIVNTHLFYFLSNTYLESLGSPLYKGILAFKHLPQDLTEQIPHHLTRDLPELLLIIGKC